VLALGTLGRYLRKPTSGPKGCQARASLGLSSPSSPGELEDAADDLRLKTEFVAHKEREIKVQQETIEAQEARKAELEGAFVAYKGALAATEGLLHVVVREGGELLAEQDKIIADLGWRSVQSAPLP